LVCKPHGFNERASFDGKKVNGRIIMKKYIGMSAVIAGMLLGVPSVNAPAAVSVYSSGSGITFDINSEPGFVYLRNQGFSVSVGSPYDIIYYGNSYYLYHAGRWYRSYSYRGPWFLIKTARIPLRIRRHRWEDIRRYRDLEYRRSDWRNNRYQRNDDNRRRLLEQKHRAPEGRQIQEQPNRAPEGRKTQEQPKRALERMRVKEQPNRAPEGRKTQEQPKRAPEGMKAQEPQQQGADKGDNKDKNGKHGRPDQVR
jgi:hypothetical protein